MHAWLQSSNRSKVSGRRILTSGNAPFAVRMFPLAPKPRELLSNCEYGSTANSEVTDFLRYWDAPQKFDARRFWVKADEDKSKLKSDPIGDAADIDDKSTTARTNGTIDTESPPNERAQSGPSVDYRTMKTWGGGKEICKGKKVSKPLPPCEYPSFVILDCLLAIAASMCISQFFYHTIPFGVFLFSFSLSGECKTTS